MASLTDRQATLAWRGREFSGALRPALVSAHGRGGTKDAEERNRQAGHTETRMWLSKRKHKAGCLRGQVTPKESRDSCEERLSLPPTKALSSPAG